MSNLHDDLAHDLVREVLAGPTTLRADPDHPGKLLVPRPDGRMAGIDLTPFEAEPQPMTAGHYFHGIKTVDGLLTAYRDARQSKPFEEDYGAPWSMWIPTPTNFWMACWPVPGVFLAMPTPKLIGDWVGQFDVYVAVKAVESLLYSQADLTLLKIAPRLGWTVHFDHLAIRYWLVRAR